MKSGSPSTSIGAVALTTVFALSALVGVWAAYDRRAAGGKFVLIAAGLVVATGIAWAGQRWGDRALGPAGVGCALLAAAVGTYFLLAYDWGNDGAGKFAVVQEAGLWIQAHRPRMPLPEDINGNVAGSALVVLIPLGFAGAVWAWRKGGPQPRPTDRKRIGLQNGRPCGPGEEPQPGLAYRSQAASAPGGPVDRYEEHKYSKISLSLAVISTLALILSLFALLLTASRGAWIGLAAGGAVALALAWSGRRGAGARWTLERILPGATISALALASAAVFIGAVTAPGLDRLLGSVGGIGNSALGRAALWRDGLALAGDYPFTGAGLSSTMMVYSTYALLLHVGSITHSHNLFLQIALEQGLPGLIAFLGLLGLALWTALRGAVAEGTKRLSENIVASHPEPVEGWLAPAQSRTLRQAQDAQLGFRIGSMGSSRIWQMAAAASLVALAVHGTADTGIYASKVLPIMFLPFGFAFAGARAVVAVRHRAERPIARYAAVATAAVVLVLALLPSTRAAFQADLGAVAQTRAELAVYRWPEWPIQDALRRSPEVNLAPAIVRFRASLALDPNNVTANRRLGQIELSRSEYDPAQSHLEAAYAAAPGQRATRQLLGEAYAIAGEVARAADIWRTVDLSDGQLSLRTWWYENNGETENARRITAAGQGAGW